MWFLLGGPGSLIPRCKPTDSISECKADVLLGIIFVCIYVKSGWSFSGPQSPTPCLYSLYDAFMEGDRGTGLYYCHFARRWSLCFPRERVWEELRVPRRHLEKNETLTAVIKELRTFNNQLKPQSRFLGLNSRRMVCRGLRWTVPRTMAFPTLRFHNSYVSVLSCLQIFEQREKISPIKHPWSG